ncbi:hypothetical protein GCM10010399_44130 [Dactylosporangium fulvum]|uniref:Uncharacterized protein n=1 Tax=Dactylosporangium fulvum TaxID=53359 RepID=A0ABY5W984_9ACTN|nr:hypothetical protein [Dactylosporangium fulvum]UWP85920.1 hypothetical protein Dfulv_17375 [Dactylosporangium fulvum]
MARPDDDHVPRAIVGADGEVLAVAHVSPDISPEAEAALRALVDAVRRDMEATDTPERRARREAGRERNARLRKRE